MSVWTKIPGSGGKVQEVAVFPINQTLESSRLADQIAAALGVPHPPGAGWTIHRNRVTFMREFAIAGVGLYVRDGVRGPAVAAALAGALNSEGILTIVIDEKLPSCGSQGSQYTEANDPGCSHISVYVGDHP
jgi:hypothetical protein